MSAGNEIRWIAFDAVGTLIFAEPPVAGVYHQIGRRYGSQYSEAEVARRFSAAYRRLAADGGLSSSEPAERDFWRSVVAEVLADVQDREACFQELYAWFATSAAWRCYEDVEPTLAALSAAGYRLAMASNFDLRLHTVHSGLPQLGDIAVCVVSSEVGWRKPHGGFFTALAAACGCEPEELLMVGDSLQSDVLGARQAGLHAVLIDRAHPGNAPCGSHEPIGSLRLLRERLVRGLEGV